MTTPDISQVQNCDDPAQLNRWCSELVDTRGCRHVAGHSRFAPAYDWDDAGPLLEDLNLLVDELGPSFDEDAEVGWHIRLVRLEDGQYIWDTSLLRCITKAAIISALMAMGES